MQPCFTGSAVKSCVLISLHRHTVQGQTRSCPLPQVRRAGGWPWFLRLGGNAFPGNRAGCTWPLQPHRCSWSLWEGVGRAPVLLKRCNSLLLACAKAHPCWLKVVTVSRLPSSGQTWFLVPAVFDELLVEHVWPSISFNITVVSTLFLLSISHCLLTRLHFFIVLDCLETVSVNVALCMYC